MPPRTVATSQKPAKEARPWVPASRPAPSAGKGGSDRKLIYEGRILGTCQEWNNTWGWIVPLQKISHPQFKSKLYCHRKDVKVEGGALVPGSTVEFLLYADSRGLGAGDVREAGPDSGAAEAGEDETLPAGWEKLWSAEHNEYYYWNKSAKEASWVPPEKGEEPADKEEDVLPAGWTMNFDPETNEYYYWHAPSKTTTWERPKAPAEEPAPPPGEEEEPAQEAAEPEVRPAAEGPVLGQQRVKGLVEKWQGFFGWIVPEEDLDEDLKPLLENRQDRIYCNWRDVREGTTIIAGLQVDFLLYADDNGLGATDVRLQKDAEKEDAAANAPAAPVRSKKRAAPPKDAMAELERQWAEQDAALAAQLGDSAEAEAAAEPASEGVQDAVDMDDAPLLPGWEQYWSEEHSCYYYWHKGAKQASWERPCMPSDGSEKRDDKVWEGEGAEEGAARMATPITPVASWAGKEITPLTPATAADREEAKLATKQPSAGFRAAQASGAFLGRGWRSDSGEATKGGAKGSQAASRPAAKPVLVKPVQKGAASGKGKGKWVMPAAAAKRPRTQ